MVDSSQQLFDVIGGLASIGGLIFSILAWRNAKEATKAAQDAREAVRKSNAGEELRELNDRARNLLRSAQKDELAEARAACAALLGPMVQAAQRWRKFIGEDGAARVRQAAKKVERVSEALSARVAPLDEEDRQKVIEFCHDVVTLLAEESGKLLVLLDEEKRND